MTTTHPVRTDCRLLNPRVVPQFPATRYQGSKRKHAAAIVEQTRDLSFSTVLDAFGGTGAVAYAFKLAGKRVTYNDALAFNQQIGLALIENDSVRLSDEEIATIGERRAGLPYGDFIERTFAGVYFTDDENRWLDTAVGNIRSLTCPYKQALAWFSVFQAAMAKRPYNLFHRSNLYMRTADVTRSFGNKVCWDRPFADHVHAHAVEANEAVFKGPEPCRAIRRDALEVEPAFDLVYIDTPYINRKGVGVDYRDFYHFLEGMVRYDDWPDLVDRGFKHIPLRRKPNRWSDPSTSLDAFHALFERFRDSYLVISYRNDGMPSIEQMTQALRGMKKRVRVVELVQRPYALSTNRRTREMLLVATD